MKPEIPGREWAFSGPSSRPRLPLASGRRGQTRLESAVALGVLLIAGVGMWMLYKDAIIETTKAMLSFFASGGGS